MVKLNQIKEVAMSNSNAAAYTVNASPRSTDDEDRRARAVSAAICIIEARASGGGEGVSLKTEFSKLSEYADLIQDALKVK